MCGRRFVSLFTLYFSLQPVILYRLSGTEPYRSVLADISAKCWQQSEPRSLRAARDAGHEDCPLLGTRKISTDSEL